MATKLTKTEAKLIAELKASQTNRIGVERYHGHGGDGGAISGGNRRFNAALSLLKKGLVVREGEINRSIKYQNGWAVHISDMTLRLPLPDEKVTPHESHPHETRAGIRRHYDVNKAGIITSLGKYENEPVFAPYFAFTASHGEELSHMEEGCGVYASLVKIDDADRAEFPELGDDDLYVLVTENDQGFVTVNVITNEAEADALRETFAPTGEEDNEDEEEIEECGCA